MSPLLNYTTNAEKGQFSEPIGGRHADENQPPVRRFQLNVFWLDSETCILYSALPWILSRVQDDESGFENQPCCSIFCPLACLEKI
jgi:hypothetical protein